METTIIGSTPSGEVPTIKLISPRSIFSRTPHRWIPSRSCLNSLRIQRPHPTRTVTHSPTVRHLKAHSIRMNFLIRWRIPPGRSPLRRIAKIWSSPAVTGSVPDSNQMKLTSKTSVTPLTPALRSCARGTRRSSAKNKSQCSTSTLLWTQTLQTLLKKLSQPKDISLSRV